MPAHQVLSLMGYIIEVSYSMSATRFNRIWSMSQSELGNTWAGIGTFTYIALLLNSDNLLTGYGQLSYYQFNITWKVQSKLINLCFISIKLIHVNPTQDGGEPKSAPPSFSTSFFPLTSTNVGTSPRNFLTFIFNPFAILV